LIACRLLEHGREGTVEAPAGHELLVDEQDEGHATAVQVLADGGVVSDAAPLPVGLFVRRPNSIRFAHPLPGCMEQMRDMTGVSGTLWT
jgi:hypothetical protein